MVGYTDIQSLSDGQNDGYVSCSLTITNATATYNSGLTMRFYLDSSNPLQLELRSFNLNQL